MDQSGLSSRAIRGFYVRGIEAMSAVSWVEPISNIFDSDQESETYKFLGQTPKMQEWVGSRQAKGFRENGITIVNKKYELTVEVELDDVRRDKTGQIRARIGEMAESGELHWSELLSELIINAESTVCYDGQFFFDTDHSEGDSGSQSNDIDADISDAPAEVTGSVTNPSVGEFQWSVSKGIANIRSMKDDQGRLMNRMANKFLVMVPTALLPAAQNALNTFVTSAMVNNMNANLVRGTVVDLVDNGDLDIAGSPWTDKFAIFRTDSHIKPLIRQRETENELQVKAEGSEFEFDNDSWQFGLKANRNVGYGLWQHAVLVTMV